MNCRRGDVERDWAMDYIERIGKGQWKYVMKLTLLRRDESGQCFLFGDDLIPDGNSLVSDGNSLVRIDRRRKQVTLKSFDRDIQLSDLFQDCFLCSHCFTISSDFPKVLSPGT